MGSQRVENRAALQLGNIIDQHQEQIEKRWLDRVTSDVVKTPGVEATSLRDGIPDYLKALTAFLRRTETSRFYDDAKTAWADVARRIARMTSTRPCAWRPQD